MNQEELCNNMEPERISNVTATESVTGSKGVTSSVLLDQLASSLSSSRDITKRSIGRDNNNCGLLMREQDADWLEAMHVNGGPNKTGMTPVLMSTTSKHSTNPNTPSSQPPSFSLSTDGDDTACDAADVGQELNLDVEATLRSSLESPIALKRKNKVLPFPSSNSPKIKSALQQPNDENLEISSNELVTTSIDTSIAQAKETSKDRISMFRNSNVHNFDDWQTTPTLPLRKPITTADRPVLSGIIYEEGAASAMEHPPKTTLNSENEDNSKTVPLRASTLYDGSIAENDTEQPILTSKQRDGFKSDDKSDSTDAKERRIITEVAQFADAVGDNAIDLQIIEDDDHGDAVHGDDDDDDDATEIHIQKQHRNLVGGLLPLKVRSNIVVGPSAIDASETTQHRVSIAPPTTASSMTPLIDEHAETPVKFRPHRVQTFSTSSDNTILQRITTEAAVTTASTETFSSSSPSRTGFLAQLPTSASMCTSHDFVYRGIGANPPEVVKRGTARGNYAQLHRKAWLEVTDKYHRYGKNLRLYYRYWESEGHPTNIFFDWLDSKGEAAGNELPEIKECPRRQLDSDTVLYITNPSVTQGYAIQVIVEDNEQHNDDTDGKRRGLMYDIDGQPVCTGPDGWIFVLRDNVLYGAKKVTSVSGQSRQRFHHSSFFGGKAVAAAGIFITDDDGYLTRLYPHSGHYRPGEAHMQRVLFYLYHAGVDLRSFDMDTQQIMHVARDTIETSKSKDKNNNGIAADKVTTEKKKKIEALHLMPAVYIACLLAHKARFIGEGIFAQIHQIRQSDVATVSEALAVIDHGGFWRK
jgi:hypothetical protein